MTIKTFFSIYATERSRFLAKLAWALIVDVAKMCLPPPNLMSSDDDFTVRPPFRDRAQNEQALQSVPHPLRLTLPAC